MTNQNKKTPIKPVSEYLVNGPIPTHELMHLDFLGSYLESGVVDTVTDIQFMLEHVCVHGAPKWWKGTVAEFEQEFHEQYRRSGVLSAKLEADITWLAAHAEVEAGRLSPLPDDPTDEQAEEFLSHGRKRRDQVWTVEFLMDMWMEAKESGII